MLDFFKKISGPVTMHLELTEACPERCRHCYNFVRDANYMPMSISKEDIDFILNDFKANGGFHVILTGGEPLLVFDKLLYAVEGVLSRGFSLSVNSNLMTASPDKMKVLKEAGVEHILTTIFSHEPTTHDFIASRQGAHTEILKGIQVTREAGIRVSVNMIVTNVNDNHVYETGRLLHKIGLRKFIANRMIPSTLNSDTLKEEFLIKDETAKRYINDLLRLNKELGMTVSTCRALPHCFLGDLNEHFDFVARGCNAGKRHLLVGVNGNARACVHEAEVYGNVKKIGIKGVWDNMEKWRRKDMLPKDCQECSLVDICEGGCRQIAEVVSGNWSEKDNLCKGKVNTSQNFNLSVNSEVLNKVKNERFIVNSDLDFRKEEDFYLVRIFGAKCVLIEVKFGDFLISVQNSGVSFTMDEFPEKNIKELGLYLRYDMVKLLNGKEDFTSLLEQYKK